MSMGGELCVVAFVLLLWLGLNGADVAWIYFYVYASLYPNRTVIKDPAGEYGGWMYFFGWFLGLCNLGVFAVYFTAGKNQTKSALKVLFDIFIVLPIAIVMILGPFFSGFAAVPLAQKAVWNRGCEGFPVQIILYPKGYNGPSTQPNLIRYFAGNDPLYTYDIFQSSADIWSLNIRTIDSPELANNISSPLYPSISNISYNFIDNTVSANCTSQNSSTTTSCIHGTFTIDGVLSFNLTDTRTNTTSNLRADNKQWTFDGYAPSVVLNDGSTGQEVVATAVENSDDCTQLKVCAAKTNGPDISVPLGIILTRQMDYAIECTTPQDSDDE